MRPAGGSSRACTLRCSRRAKPSRRVGSAGGASRTENVSRNWLKIRHISGELPNATNTNNVRGRFTARNHQSALRLTRTVREGVSLRETVSPPCLKILHTSATDKSDLRGQPSCANRQSALRLTKTSARALRRTKSPVRFATDKDKCEGSSPSRQ